MFKNSFFAIFFLMLFSLPSSSFSSECWVVSGLKGIGSNSADQYNLHEDSLDKRSFQIIIDGDNSSVTGSEGISFFEVTPQLIVGAYASGGYKGVVESWGIDVEQNKVFYTQSKSGYSIFDGAKLFIGTLDGRCD